MLDHGRLELVPEEQVELEKNDENFLVHYLIWFPADSKKFRVVYNGKMPYNGVCINDLLHRETMFFHLLLS